MKITEWLKLGFLLLVATAAIAVSIAWQAVRRDQTQLQAKLNNAEQQLSQATAQQESRRVALEKQLAEIRRQRSAVHSPEEVIKALPQVLPLPTPILVPANPRHDQQPSDGPPTQAAGEGRSSTAKRSTEVPPNASAAVPVDGGGAPQVQLPAEDLKPLYDFALGCKECQATLAAAQGDLKDEQSKTQTLRRERDSALQAARGGTVLRRVGRAAKWFAIGAAVGAAAAKCAH